MATPATKHLVCATLFITLFTWLCCQCERASAVVSSNTAFKFVKEDKSIGLQEYRENSNGLTILLQEKHNTPVVTVMVMYKVGSRNEAVGYTGSTHFLEHMMFKGTTNHDPLKGNGLDDILKPMGGINNASTSYDRTDYYEVVPSVGLAACLDLESDRMRHALLRDGDRHSEMTVVRNELERGENTAENILETQVFATAFREHPYHHPIIGWRSDVEGVPTGRLQQFYHDFYYPNNATLIVIGDFKTAATLDLINKYFSKVPALSHPFPKVYTTEPPQEGERRFTVQRGDELPKIMLGYHIPNAVNKDAYPLEVLASVLGDEKKHSSRLYKKLVDSGLASQASAANMSMRDPGLFTVYASASSGVKLELVEKAIEDELKELAEHPASEKELERARKAVWKKMKLEADDPAEFAQQLSDAEAVADWTWLTNIEKNLNKVTAAQVQEVAKKYFASSNRSVGYYLPKDKAAENKDEKKGADKSDKTGDKTGAKTSANEIGDKTGDNETGDKTGKTADNKPSDNKAGAKISDKLSESDTATGSSASLITQLPVQALDQVIAKNNGGTSVSSELLDAKSMRKQANQLLASADAASNSQTASKGIIATTTKKKVLANGLTVYVLPVRGSGIVAVSAKVKGGENGAQIDKTLVPCLVADMLDKGSAHTSKEEFADTIESMGSSFDPQLEPFWVEIASEVVTEDLDNFLAIMSDAMHSPLFPADELAKLKKQKESELKDQMVETAELAANKLLSVIYQPGCVYYQRPYEEQLAELPRITVDDLKEFHQKKYGACNVNLALVGDLTEEQGFALAEKYFGNLDRGTPADMSTKNCACNEKFKVKQIVSTLPDKSNVDVYMGYPADLSITSKDFCASQLANAALGHDTLASRLAVIREKYGLSYDVHSMFSENAEPWAPWVVQLSVNPENTDKALKLVDSIVSDYVSKGMTPTELALEKQRISGEYVVYRMRSPKNLADALSKYGSLGLGPDFMDRYPSMLRAVTLKEADAAISKYMKPGNLVNSLAGSVPASIKNK